MKGPASVICVKCVPGGEQKLQRPCGRSSATAGGQCKWLEVTGCRSPMMLWDVVWIFHFALSEVGSETVLSGGGSHDLCDG